MKCPGRIFLVGTVRVGLRGLPSGKTMGQSTERTRSRQAPQRNLSRGDLFPAAPGPPLFARV